VKLSGIPILNRRDIFSGAFWLLSQDCISRFSPSFPSGSSPIYRPHLPEADLDVFDVSPYRPASAPPTMRVFFFLFSPPEGSCLRLPIGLPRNFHIRSFFPFGVLSHPRPVPKQPRRFPSVARRCPCGTRFVNNDSPFFSSFILPQHCPFFRRSIQAHSLLTSYFVLS